MFSELFCEQLTLVKDRYFFKILLNLLVIEVYRDILIYLYADLLTLFLEDVSGADLRQDSI